MNPQYDYYNFALRYLETTNQILRQMDSVNRNLYYIMNGNRNNGYQRRHTATNNNNNNIWNNAYTNFTRPLNTNTNPNNNTNLNNWTTQFLNNTFWDTVLVYPTPQQIEAATTSVSMSDLPPGITNCPITMESFNAESEILRINHCGHYFSRDAILRWFRNHVSCPVCRHDIRQEPNENQTNNDNENEPAAAEGQNNNNTTNVNVNDVSNARHQIYQFDLTLDNNTDLLTNVINGLNNLNLGNDNNLVTRHTYDQRRYQH